MKKIIFLWLLFLFCLACVTGMAEQSHLTATVPAEHSYSVQIGDHGSVQIGGKRYTGEANVIIPRFDALTIEIKPEWGYLLSDVRASNSAHVTLDGDKIIIDSAVLDTTFALSFSEVTSPVMRLGVPELSVIPGVSVTMPAEFAPSTLGGMALQVTWTSSDPSVVRIDKNGNMVCLRGGDAIITGTCGDLSASCSVHVGEMNSLLLPAQLKQIQDSAFEGNTSIEAVTAPAVTRIGKNAFRDCTALKMVRLPSSVEMIDEGAFVNSPSLVILCNKSAGYVIQYAAQNDIPVLLLAD